MQQKTKINYKKDFQLSENLIASGKTAEISFDDFPVQLIAKEYGWSRMSFMGTITIMLSDSELDFWAPSGKPLKIDYTPLYNFSQISEEMQLPVNFTADVLIPGNYLVTELNKNTRRGDLIVKLKSINWANKLLYLKD